MEHNDEAYAPAAGSLFFTSDCQHLDQLSLLKSPLHDTDKTVDAAVDQPDNVTMGSMMFDMLNMQFPSGSAPPNEKLLLSDGIHVPDQHRRAGFCHFIGDMDAAKEQEQGFDPVCFLKLPVLAEKGLEQRYSSHNYHEYTPLAPLKNDMGDDGMKAHGGGNNWQEDSCIEYSLAPVSRSRLESHKEEADAHHEENNLIQSFIESEIMVPEHRLCSRSVHSSKLVSIDHPLVYNSDGLHPVVLSRSSSGFDPPQIHKAKRKRSKTCKSSEEIESQRMTHIAVERNRRKQMNEHLRVLRALMPGSYVQRGDQASIIGGAIEFVKELEQLLQCLESQKRRRLYSDGPRPANPMSNYLLLQPPAAQQIVSYPLPNDAKLVDGFLEPLREEVAEVKSPVADIEVKLAVGGDATIKILSERRPRQLLNTIAALENLQFSIFHTNVTTIEHTVLYSFNVKVNVEHLSSAEDIATSVQQIFSMIQAPAGYLE